MAKKRKGLKVKTEKKIRLEEPNPESEDYIYDEVEKFHRSKDKILLNPSDNLDDSDLEDDETNEEVLGIGDSGESIVSEEEKEVDDGNELSEEEISTDDETNIYKGLPSDKAWGKSKKSYYDVDVQDEDIEASDEDAEMAAEEEEKEAMTLQKRMAEKLKMDDFYFIHDKNDGQAEDDKESTTTVVKDLSKLSKKEKLEILVKESPELLPMLEEYKERLAEVVNIYHPLLLLARRSVIQSQQGKLYIEMKHQLLLNYLANLSFYLALKASKDTTKGHPVFNVLLQHKQLLTDLQPLDEKFADEMESLLSGSEFNSNHLTELNSKTTSVKTPVDGLMNILKGKSKGKNLDKKVAMETDVDIDNEELDAVDPIEYYRLVKSQHESKKIKDQEKSDTEDENPNAEEELDEDGKRKITYEMSKNKGLIRKRRKELKNPRVKHKMRFKKAKIKHKGLVREVQREISRYAGETTGIKAMLKRSTKIK